MRSQRKDEHIKNYLKSEYVGDTLLEDVYIEHNALPEVNFDEVDTSIELFGKKVNFPLLINSMTGGTLLAEEINSDLSMLAEEFGLPMAVGSQNIGLEDDDAKETFSIIRESLGKDNVVIGNLNGFAELDDAKKAIDMIDADRLAIHLNPTQELVMKEGDRNFKGILDNIRYLNESLPGKIMVKEIGNGISKDVMKKLVDAGITTVDISGHGGTNFVEIEDMRDYETDFSELYSWGIPTAKAIIDGRSVSKDITIIASGGIKCSMDIVKSIVIGADVVGISGELLKYVIHGGYDYAKQYIESLIKKTKIIMVLLGASNIEELKKVPYKTTGRLKDILD